MCVCVCVVCVCLCACTSHIDIFLCMSYPLFDKIWLYPYFTLRPNDLFIPSVAGKQVGGLQETDEPGFRLKLPDTRSTREITVFSNLGQGQSPILGLRMK